MPIGAERLARTQLAKLRQVDGPVRRYIFELRRLLLRVTDLTPADALHRFIQGRKPALAHEVNIRDPLDLDTTMSIAQRADLFNYRAHVAATLSSQRAAGGGPSAMELSMIDVPVRRFQGYCRNCGKWGHRAGNIRSSLALSMVKMSPQVPSLHGGNNELCSWLKALTRAMHLLSLAYVFRFSALLSLVEMQQQGLQT
jgi:hypothetical protein